MKISSQILSLLLIFTLSSHLSACSTKSHFQLEAQASKRTLNWLKKEYGLLRNPELQSYLNKILFRVASGTSTASLAIKLPSNQATVLTTWRLFVLKHQEPNAFAIGGGSIVISDSLLKLCETEAELASIVSHEMSHQMLGHIDKALELQTKQSKSSKGKPAISYSLKDEMDADALGILLLKLARYDAREAITALSIGYRRKYKSVSKKNDKLWLEKRAAKIQKAIANTSFKFSTRNTRDFNRAQKLLWHRK